MSVSRISLIVFVFLSVFVSAQDKPSADDSAFAGTWFGSIAITGPDGNTSHDTAVMVISPGATVGGSIGQTIDRQTAFSNTQVTGNTLRFHLDAAGGLDFTLRLDGRRITGTAAGGPTKAELDLHPAPGLVPHDRLVQEITAADRALFAAFEACDAKDYGSFLSPDLEFYQDRTGKTDYAQNLQSLKDRCNEGIRLRRELVEGTLVINAAPGFGAIEAGTQRFYSRQADGSEHLDATSQFTNVWSKASGNWKLVRIVSYDHR